ncbi:MAG: RelA/SpoT domain-containing protein [Nanoarchaeota archaeon]|nr:RelA/SpoT domain-containing protein [Nanoarchaeota archaeon]
MKWTYPLNTKSQVNKVGIILAKTQKIDLEKEAIKILNNWRASHSYPLQIFRNRLEKFSTDVDKDAITVKRLKRVPSIIRKLREPKATKLTRMQDIGGCRAVLQTVTLAEKLFECYYLKKRLKHKRVKIQNYVLNPKPDGYRSIHVVYNYKSDKEQKQIFDGLLIEIQIRSKLQHLWSTAVEIVDFYTNQAIKFGGGKEKWKEFLRLVSSAFARWENRPLVPNTPTSEKELYQKIKELESELSVINRMLGWAHSIKPFERMKAKNKYYYCLLELDTKASKITITGFSKRLEKKALEQYSEAEERNRGRKEYDVVLVGADTIEDIKKAYPNYFVDVREFVKRIKYIINKRLT